MLLSLLVRGNFPYAFILVR